MSTETKVEAVARYFLNIPGSLTPDYGLVPDQDGQWVDYDDHQSAITALEGEVERLRTEAAKWQGLYKSLELVCEVQERRIERGTALTKESP